MNFVQVVNTVTLLKTITTYILQFRWLFSKALLRIIVFAQGKAGSEKVVFYSNKSVSDWLLVCSLGSPYSSLWLTLDYWIDDSFYFFFKDVILYPHNPAHCVEQYRKFLFQLVQQNCFSNGIFPNVYILKTKIIKQ